MTPDDCELDQSGTIPLIDGMFLLRERGIDRPSGLVDRDVPQSAELHVIGGGAEIGVAFPAHDDVDEVFLYVTPFGRGQRLVEDVGGLGFDAVGQLSIDAAGPLVVSGFGGVEHMYATPHRGHIDGVVYCHVSDHGDPELQVTLSLWERGSPVHDWTRSPREQGLPY